MPMSAALGAWISAPALQYETNIVAARLSPEPKLSLISEEGGEGQNRLLISSIFNNLDYTYFWETSLLERAGH
jgi:hypothetical protein